MTPDILRKIQEAVQKFAGEQIDPRILVIGATGVGKSTLINAVFGKKVAPVNTVASTTRSFKTHEYKFDADTRVHITDSQGYGEVGHDAQYTRDAIAEASNAHAVALILKADEKGYERDLTIITMAGKDSQFALTKPLLIAVNQIDKIKPAREWSPPYDLDAPPVAEDSQKLTNIREKLALVKTQFGGVICGRTVHVIPTMSDADEGTMFGVDSFKLHMFQSMPEAARYLFARTARLAEQASAAVLKEIDAEAGKIIKVAASACATAVFANPIPATDFIVLAPVQIGMIIKLGNLYGKRIDPASALEVISALGAGFGARQIFQGIISLIPFPAAKQLLGAPYAAAATHGMGVAARAYFKGQGVPSEAELKKTVEEELKRQTT